MQGSRQWRRGLLWHPTRVHHASVAYVPGQPGDLWTLPLRLSAPAPAPAASDLPPGALSPSIPFLPALGAPPKAGGCLSAFPKSLHMEICPSWKPRGFFVLFWIFFLFTTKECSSLFRLSFSLSGVVLTAVNAEHHAQCLGQARAQGYDETPETKQFRF